MYPNVPECTSVFGPNVLAALSHFATSLYYKFIREMQLMSRMCLNVPLFLLLACAWFQVPDQKRKLLSHCLICALVQLSDSAHGLWLWSNFLNWLSAHSKPFMTITLLRLVHWSNFLTRHMVSAACPTYPLDRLTIDRVHGRPEAFPVTTVLDKCTGPTL